MLQKKDNCTELVVTSTHGFLLHIDYIDPQTSNLQGKETISILIINMNQSQPYKKI